MPPLGQLTQEQLRTAFSAPFPFSSVHLAGFQPLAPFPHTPLPQTVAHYTSKKPAKRVLKVPLSN